MIADKGLPALGRRVSSPDHILGHARLSDIDAELESSPWTRRAPHSGFTTLISRISPRISSGTVGRPPRGRDFQRQYDLNPARCQRTMVSGFTIANASRTLGNNRYRPTNTKRSMALKESFFGAVRRRTFICCRNVQISASSAARERIRSTTIQPISLQRSLMAQQHRPILYQLPARQGLGQGQPDSSSNARTSCPLSLTRDRNRRATDSSDLRRFSRSLRYAPAAFPAAIQRSKVRAENAHQAPAFSGVCFSSMTGRVGARSAFNPTQCAHSGGRSASS